jgi:GR25 family glycosyltransferase involved in LPS biosynthesis
MIDAYVISLNKPLNILYELKKYNLNSIWSKGLKYDNFDDEYIKKHTSSFYYKYGPKSSIAIAMSHIKTWRKFLLSEKELCIIFEDDVVIVKDFDKELEIALQNVPSDFDILYLGCFGCNSDLNCLTVPFSFIYNLKNTKLINDYVIKPKVAFALHGYVLSKKGAEKLVTYIYKNINNHIDVMIFKLYNEDKIKLYSLKNRIAYQTSSDTCKSLNTSNYPFLINKLLSPIKIDKMVSLSYYTSVSFLRLGNFNINAMTILFLIMGIVLKTNNTSIKNITIGFIILSLPDLLSFKYIDTIITYYFILIFPSLIKF